MKFVCVTVLLALVAFAAAEELPDSCICPRIFMPICGTDGVTYSNKCAFECTKGKLVGRAAEELQILKGGECEGPEIPEFLVQ